MTLATAQLSKQDSLLLTKRRSSEGKYDGNEKTSTKQTRAKEPSCAPPKLMEKDSIALTKKRTPNCAHEQSSCVPPKLMEKDSIALTKKKTPNCVHERDDGLLSDMEEEPRSKPIFMKLNDAEAPSLVRKKSLNSIFKEVSLKHHIPESALDNPLLKKQDSVVLTKRRSPECVHA